jgi:hypothetical protein
MAVSRWHHNATDRSGAPAARFSVRLAELLESGYGLDAFLSSVAFPAELSEHSRILERARHLREG